MNVGEKTKAAIRKLTGQFSYRQKAAIKREKSEARFDSAEREQARTKFKRGLLVIAGVVCGLGGLFMYLLRAHTYFVGDDPSACVNCHIMTPYYATWSHSSHGRIDNQSNGATCNDCHVPHQNLALKYGFKAMDGLKHTAYFVMHSERQAPMAETLTGQVVMDNCIRCHTQLNTEFVKTGRMGYMQQLAQGGKVCWDCHRNVPHGGMNSLMATPGAEGVTPLPPSPVPEWLQKLR